MPTNMWIQRKALAATSTIASLWSFAVTHRHKYRSVSSEDVFLEPFRSTLITPTISLDLGCGSNPRNPFFATTLCGIDIRDDLGNNVKRANLATSPIPYPSNSFDYCTAYDFLEHIPRIELYSHTAESRSPFIELMNEIHRVLKPGGIFFHRTPAYPSKEVFSDPTHVNIITEETMPSYFCEPFNTAGSYGYGFCGAFELADQCWLSNIWLLGAMRAIK